MNKRCLVLTTVNKPTEAIRQFIRTDYDVIVVGDRKTPGDYASLDCIFLDMHAQHTHFPTISELLPVDSYARKNIGYLYAIQHGYDIIAESDDDNIPYEHWGALDHRFSHTVVSPEYPNMYAMYTDQHIWPRGFPLEHIRAREPILLEEKDSHVFVIQSLADGDPDVDAIFRLVLGGHATPVFGQGTYVLDRNILSPFNSQNTFWINRSAFPYLYLPATVSFRCCDILRSYVAQYGIWPRGGQLAFTAASVRQERNPHDLREDFESETQLYLHFHTMMEAMRSVELQGDHDDLYTMYRALYNKGMVARRELRIVREWLRNAEH